MTDSRAPEMERVNCPLCGSGDFKTLFVARDHFNGAPGKYTIARCMMCSLVMQNPRPAPEAMASLYPESYEPHRLAAGAVNMESMVDGQEPRRALLEKFSAKGRNLDVGSGDGRFILCLKRAGWDVEGCEFVGRMAEYQRGLGLSVKTGDLLTAGYATGEFDSVTFWAVLEHLYNPVETLLETSRILKPGGVAIISLPNFNSVERMAFGEYWFPLQLPHHLYFFTPRTIKRTVEKAGMKLEKTFFSTTATGVLNSVKKIVSLKKDGAEKGRAGEQMGASANNAPEDIPTSGGLKGLAFNLGVVPALKILDALHVGGATNYVVRKT